MISGNPPTKEDQDWCIPPLRCVVLRHAHTIHFVREKTIANLLEHSYTSTLIKSCCVERDYNPRDHL